MLDYPIMKRMIKYLDVHPYLMQEKQCKVTLIQTMPRSAISNT